MWRWITHGGSRGWPSGLQNAGFMSLLFFVFFCQNRISTALLMVVQQKVQISTPHNNQKLKWNKIEQALYLKEFKACFFHCRQATISRVVTLKQCSAESILLSLALETLKRVPNTQKPRESAEGKGAESRENDLHIIRILQTINQVGRGQKHEKEAEGLWEWMKSMGAELRGGPELVIKEKCRWMCGNGAEKSNQRLIFLQLRKETLT